MRAVLLAPVLLLSGCARDADFRLPPPGAAEPGIYHWSEHPEPVLLPGAHGAFDAQGVLAPCVFHYEKLLWILYSAFDGVTWHTGLSASADGFSWNLGRRSFSPREGAWEGEHIAAGGCAVVRQELIHYWYQAGSPTRIGLAVSHDGRYWRREPEPVLANGEEGAWDEAATADPHVLEIDGRLYMYYRGENSARRHQLGVAVSGDGVRWTRHRANPVLRPGEPGAFDEAGVTEPAVWRARGRYWMLYAGVGRDGQRRLGLARSPDGVAWERTPLVIEGTREWNRDSVSGASVLVEGEKVRVWFGAGGVVGGVVGGLIGYGLLEWRAR